MPGASLAPERIPALRWIAAIGLALAAGPAVASDPSGMIVVVLFPLTWGLVIVPMLYYLLSEGQQRRWSASLRLLLALATGMLPGAAATALLFVYVLPDPRPLGAIVLGGGAGSVLAGTAIAARIAGRGPAWQLPAWTLCGKAMWWFGVITLTSAGGLRWALAVLAYPLLTWMVLHRSRSMEMTR